MDFAYNAFNLAKRATKNYGKSAIYTSTKSEYDITSSENKIVTTKTQVKILISETLITQGLKLSDTTILNNQSLVYISDLKPKIGDFISYDDKERKIIKINSIFAGEGVALYECIVE